MFIKIKPFVFFIFLCLFSTSVPAAVEPKNTVVFFLPVQKYEEITTVQEAVPSVMPKGDPKEMSVKDELKKNPDHEKHGIPTKVGVSLYDKGNVPLDVATENILAPAKVLILPPENLRKKASNKAGSKTPESVWPYKLRVFPLIEPSAEIKKAAKKKLAPVRYPPLQPPKDPREQRPDKIGEWTEWALKEMENCNMDAQTVLPTLYWLTQNGELSEGFSSCDIKEAVAEHLQKCHPWPVVYYTPVNNDVPVRPPVQMAVEYLETDFEDQVCPVLDLSGVNFERVDFIRGNLKDADFSKSYLHETTFIDFGLDDAIFSGSILDNVYFQNTQLSRAEFKNVRMKDGYIYKGDAAGTVFDSSDLQNSRFIATTLTNARFPNAVLQNTDWRDVIAYRLYAPSATFFRSVFDNVLMDQMQAGRADFGNIVCKNCVWKSSFLDYAYFYGSLFENTSFDRAKLSYADFRSAVFGEGVSFADVALYKADFAGADLKRTEGIPIDKMMHTKIDKETQRPESLQIHDSEIYDVEFDGDKEQKDAEINRYTCSPQVCTDRLLGRVNNHNLAVRAMTLLTDPNGKTEDQIWALCTIGCIADRDKKLETSQVDTLAAFVKRNRRWDVQNDLFRPYTPIPIEVQMALYILTDPKIKRDLGRDVDLTETDLRTADLSRGNLRDIDFSGSHLGGANLSGSKTDLPVRRFDRVVIDEFTRMPGKMRGAFRRFELTDSIVPPWWKPKTVRIYRDGSHLWTVTTEEIPFSDDMIVGPEEGERK